VDEDLLRRMVVRMTRQLGQTLPYLFTNAEWEQIEGWTR
jgi:hypothetical protein